MFLLINVIIVTGGCSVALTPVAEPLSVAFNVKPLSVAMANIVFHITYIPMTFVAIKLYNEVKPTLIIRLACVNLIIGGWIRIFARKSDNFTWILAGFTIMSLSYPMFLSGITLICNKWMGDTERTFMI